MSMRRPTIADVAQHAHVSPTAVSFAFNNPSQLNPATVERILEAAQQLGYTPNPHARALHARRSDVIGVLVPQALSSVLDNPFFPAFLQGIGSICDEHGLGLLTISPLFGSLNDAIIRAPVDGFIIVGLNEYHEEVAPLLRRKVPCVIVDGDAQTFSSVNADDASGAYPAAAHLLAHGHQHLLLLAFETLPDHSNDPYFGVGYRRAHSYQRAFAEYHASWDAKWLKPTVSTIEGGAQSFEDIWEQGLRPTAILAVSDAMAIGAIKAALRHGIRIPEELEVIGFDDVPLAALIKPALSTVRQPIVEKGRVAAELLVAALDGSTTTEHVLLPTELILRETTRP